MIDRQICRISGCNNWGELRNTVKGVRRYRDICETHRRPKRQNRKPFNLSICENCGASEKCHRHRIGGIGTPYIRENVIVLCYECHFVEHGKLWAYKANNSR